MRLHLVVATLASGFVLAACEPKATQESPQLPYSTGTVQEQLRRQQLENARSNPGVQNAAPSSVNPGTTGIVRGTGGRGDIGAGAPVSVNPGTTGIVREGVGAPMR